MDNTKASLSKIKMEIFSARLALSGLEENTLKRRYKNRNDLKDCCQIDRDRAIDLEVELYLATVELEAYKAKLYRRDPAFIARKRNEALEAYRLKYESDLMERGEARCYDEVDLMERGELFVTIKRNEPYETFRIENETVGFDEVDLMERGELIG